MRGRLWGRGSARAWVSASSGDVAHVAYGYGLTHPASGLG